MSRHNLIRLLIEFGVVMPDIVERMSTNDLHLRCDQTLKRGGWWARSLQAHLWSQKAHPGECAGVFIADHVEPVNMSDCHDGEHVVPSLPSGRRSARSSLKPVMSHRLARRVPEYSRWNLQTVTRRLRAFRLARRTWIVERTLAWVRHDWRFSQDFSHALSGPRARDCKCME